MILTIDVPDDIYDAVKDQKLYLIAGTRECIAEKFPDSTTWLVKTVRCNNCGECCMDIDDTPGTPRDSEGKCTHLIQNGDKWECNSQDKLPASCILGNPRKSNFPYCIIESEER